MSLKTKGFSRETEALILIGGGENRTLVLSKLHSNDYMLIAFFNTSILKEGATLRIDVLLSDLESLFQKAERIEFIPGFMTIVLMLLVRP